MIRQSIKIAFIAVCLLGVLCGVLLLPASADTTRQFGVHGDLDGDGEVTVSDARILLQYLVKKIDFNDFGYLRAMADVNGDNAVDINDARLVLQKIVGKIDTFPWTPNLLFVGNSLTYWGLAPESMRTLCRLSGRPLTVLKHTPPTTWLGDYLNHYAAGFYEYHRQQADIVVLQNMNDYILPEPECVAEFRSYFRPGTRFYSLMTEYASCLFYDWDPAPPGDVTPIPCGLAFWLLRADPRTADFDLYDPDGFHPNELYGYLQALTAYAVIYQTTCVGLPYDFLSDKALTCLGGGDIAEKILLIQQKVMEAVAADPADYPVIIQEIWKVTDPY
ncbi:MAG: dockerin type I repeat-containing protein [Oscillospiraceae bacterium]|nr:dockerin type I repeat-containing protein [Oscillospiraceae bacterium]